MNAHDRLVDLLVSGLGRDLDGDVYEIVEETYHQSREIALALDADWRAVLLSLTDHVSPEQLLYRPHLWFQVNDARRWEREARLFACDCAERVLFIFEATQPDVSRLLDVIQVARRFAGGKPSRRLTVARDAAESAARGVWATSAMAQGAVWVASSVARAAADSAEAAAWGAAKCAARAAELVGENRAAAARLDERNAQWALLVAQVVRRS